MMQSTPAPPAAPALAPDEVLLTIDGKQVVAKKGTLLVEAAKQVGVNIPVFCYHPKLKPVGACRMCLVTVEKLPRLQTACTTPVAADMVVHTNTPDVVAAQTGVLELLLANHPLDCPVCDKGGECPLQDNTFAYGPGVSRFTEEKRHKEKALPLSERIVLDRERCIMCYRCTRFHQEIPGDEALAAIARGGNTEIGTPTGESYDSIFSGNTIELCPVGALTSRQYRFKARPWDLVRTPSVCTGCAVGCNLEVHSRVERVVRLVSRENRGVDDGWLCDVGRFDTVPAPTETRPAGPMMRPAGGGPLQAVGWTEALARAASLMQGQGGASGLLASPSLSNEALWLLGRAPMQGAALWPPAATTWPVQGSIANLAACKAVVLVGLDVWNELPVLALWMHQAVSTRGATLVVVNAANGMAADTAHWLRAPSGWEADVAAALAEAVDGQPARGVGDITAEHVFSAATALRAPGGTGPAALLVGAGVVSPEAARASLERLARGIGATAETGLVGAPSTAANGRGASDLAPSLADGDAAEVLGRARAGQVSSLLLFGDEAWAEVDTGHARLVLATSRPVPVEDDPRVDVVLPIAHPYERQGSITNLEGRVQLQEGGATPPRQARPDWAVASLLLDHAGISIPDLDGRPGRLADIRLAMAAAGGPLAEAFQPVSHETRTPAAEAGVQRG